ncbi:MAG: CotH kinase family protein [Oscillospiraceae bacterium]|nr:CotH kinase family protein [Oscillospiraceae bacterium]
MIMHKRKSISLILVLTMFIFILNSCNGGKTANIGVENTNATTPVSYINTSNVGVNEQSVTDLYYRTGISDLKMKTLTTLNTDPFNLRLSHNNYFYTDDIQVEITCDMPGASIYYTLNGATPVKGLNDMHNIIYTGPVLLAKTDYNSPYVLKAVAFTDSSQSNMITHTYFVSAQIADRFNENLYVFSISSDPDGLYSYENGILVAGKLRDDFIKANPRHQLIPPDPANFNLKGIESERKSYIEVFTSNGQIIVSQTAGIRVHGAWSRDSDKQSLALYARSSYDTVFDKFYYPFFNFFGTAGMKDGYDTPIQSYPDLLLRNGANDRYGSNMREELSQTLAKQAGFLNYKEIAPAAVFLNGQYYGFMWLEQFYDENYFINEFGGDSKDTIEIDSPAENAPADPDPGNVLDDTAFEQYKNIMDIDSYMQYFAFEIYTGNQDWPHNNIKYWRYTGGDGTDINQYYDGKYRMLLYDDEMAWGMYGAGSKERTINRVITANTSVSFIALMKRPDMVEKFCNQMFDLLNTVFTYDNILDNYNKIVSLYDDEINMSIKKNIPPGYNKNTLKSERQAILSFAKTRAIVVEKDMSSSFKIADDTYSVNVIGKDGCGVTLNTIKLSGAGNIIGSYFTAHSVILTASPYPGYKFDHWSINGNIYTDAEITLNSAYAVNGNINAELFAVPDDSYSDCVINTIYLDSNLDMVELFNPGNAEAVLKNVYISNDIADLKKFYIPRLILPAKTVMDYYGINYYDYVNTYNSDKNNKDKLKKVNGNHVFNFKIKLGDTIYLSSDNGEILKSIYIPKQFTPNDGQKVARQIDGTYKVIQTN